MEFLVLRENHFDSLFENTKKIFTSYSQRKTLHKHSFNNQISFCLIEVSWSWAAQTPAAVLWCDCCQGRDTESQETLK